MPTQAKVDPGKQTMRDFAQAVVGAVFDGELSGSSDFALGFAAAVDGMSRGCVNTDDPAGVVMLAARDVYRPPVRRWWVTPMMADFFERDGGGEDARADG